MFLKNPKKNGPFPPHGMFWSVLFPKWKWNGKIWAIISHIPPDMRGRGREFEGHSLENRSV